jgi:hypothetical protein
MDNYSLISYSRNDILVVHFKIERTHSNLSRTITKYIAIILMLCYQINISHHQLTLAVHEISHLVGQYWHHGHFHHHKHSTVHQSDHKHRILFSFEESFVKHSDQTPTLPETSKVVHLSFDKHLLSKTFLPNASSFQLHSSFDFFQQITLSTSADVPVPPPRNVSIFL